MTRRSLFCLLVVCLLVCPGLSQVPKLEQCLVSGIYSLVRLPEPQDALSCWTDCSAEAECHMAVMVSPVSGSAQCLLVNCQKHGKHSYTRQPSDQITVYPKNTSDDDQRRHFLNGAYGRADERHHCHERMNYSSCQTGAPRFFYNRTSYRCERFYSGCGSTKNMFETQEGCEALCNEKFRCYRPVQYGGCSAHMPKFFYNISSERCERFIFSSCGSNGNIFPTVEECESLCGDVKGTTTSPPADHKDFKAANQPAVVSDTTAAVPLHTALIIAIVVVSIVLLSLVLAVIVQFLLSRHTPPISYRELLRSDPDDPDPGLLSGFDVYQGDDGDDGDDDSDVDEVSWTPGPQRDI